MQTTTMRRRFGREFKFDVVRQVDLGLKSKAQVCREHSLSPSLLDRWVDQYRAKGEAAFAERQAKDPDPQARIRELEASLGRAHLEIEFMREAFSILRSPERRSP